MEVAQLTNSLEEIKEVDPVQIAEIFGNVGGFWGESTEIEHADGGMDESSCWFSSRGCVHLKRAGLLTQKTVSEKYCTLVSMSNPAALQQFKPHTAQVWDYNDSGKLLA